MKRILVTGSNGLLGQKITDAMLSDDSCTYIATSKGVNRHPVQTGYTYVPMNILVEAEARQVIETYRPDVLINTAAMANVDACERDPEGSYKMNVEAVSNLVKLCEEYQIHLIHLSTDFVFDGEQGPYDEKDEPNPLNTYGKHKLEAEKKLAGASCPWTVVRTILVYGVLQDMSRSNIVLWAKQALEKGQKITAVNDQWRMPTLAEDLAAACLTVAKRQAEGVFHISGKDLFSICEMVDAVAEHWQLDSSFICKEPSAVLKQDARRPKRTGFILDKAYEKLDYMPHSFVDGLELIKQQLKTLSSEQK